MRAQKLTKAFFPIPEDPDKTEFEIKHLRAGESSKIAQETHLQRFEFKKDENDEMQPVPLLEINKIKETGMSNMAAITGWKNVFDEDGEALPYSLKNKSRFFRDLSEQNYLDAMAFITEKRIFLAEKIAKQEKKELGN